MPALAALPSNGGGGSVSFVTAVDVIVTCVDDETGLVIPNVRVGAETTTGQNEVINELTSASGVADNIGYNLPADPTEIIIRCYDEGDAGQHAPVTRIVDVTGNGLDITIRMPNNPQYTPT